MTSGPTRDIARAAVRAELAQVAFEVFRRDGFDRVTLNDVAAEAGVSRSTFLRYFPSKEDAVLGGLNMQGQRFVTALRARPAAEVDWTALRRAMDALLEDYHRDPANALARTQLIYQTPALHAGCQVRQAGWRPALAHTLTGRATSRRPAASGLAATVRAAAAIDCLNIASEHWADTSGRRDLGDLLDEAFAALAPRPQSQARTLPS
ncbi:TetR/AcrR family transcriptional regulator [Frankia sp. Cpl3]|uniref:TetR family transcriptional regulator n=1 Tax=Parafrankia colletiae TaxID=573497 RepID=UPI000A430870|nr:TetR family transcriptional regulator [Parafrankia colletiae]MCK9903101.1 TetR/AcrR family transcriptional regulator [Frankia sp. Cpl3]